MTLPDIILATIGNPIKAVEIMRSHSQQCPYGCGFYSPFKNFVAGFQTVL